MQPKEANPFLVTKKAPRCLEGGKCAPIKTPTVGSLGNKGTLKLGSGGICRSRGHGVRRPQYDRAIAA